MNIEEMTSRKTGAKYPNLVIKNPNDAIPVVIRSLEKGDMQLIIEHNGMSKVVAYISRSALNIDKLLRINSEMIFSKDESTVLPIKDIPSYLSCIC